VDAIAKITIEDGLFLKTLELREAEELMLLVDANRPYLREWLPWLDVTRSIDEMIVFVESTQRQLAASLGFQTAIWHHGQIVGIIGYHHLEWANRSTVSSRPDEHPRAGPRRKMPGSSTTPLMNGRIESRSL
jgi:hypothetical protein